MTKEICKICGSRDIATQKYYDKNRKLRQRLMCLACGGYKIKKGKNETHSIKKT